MINWQATCKTCGQQIDCTGAEYEEVSQCGDCWDKAHQLDLFAEADKSKPMVEDV